MQCYRGHINDAYVLSRCCLIFYIILRYHNLATAWKIGVQVSFDDTVITVPHGGSLAKGDKVLLVILQDFAGGDTDEQTGGLHEFYNVEKVNGNKVTVVSADKDGVTILDPEKGGTGDEWGKVRVLVLWFHLLVP